MTREILQFEEDMRAGRRNLWKYDEVSSVAGFDKYCRLIVRKYDSLVGAWRRTDGRRVGEISPHDWLRFHCYCFIQIVIARGQVPLFEHRIRSQAYGGRGRKGTRNICRTGLLAIFAHQKSSLKSRDRDRFGQQLNHAYRHFVPAPFLQGFLQQSKAVKTDNAGWMPIDPQFSDWVAEELFNATMNRHQNYRGKYPRAITAQVANRIRHRVTDEMILKMKNTLEKYEKRGGNLEELGSGLID